MRAQDLVAMAFASVLLSPGGAAAEENCPYRENPAKLFPGIALGKSYPAVKAQVPASAGCGSKRREWCHFIDRYGIDNHFSDFQETLPGGEERELFLRTQVRARGGWLPYEVRWTDSFAEAMSKLRDHGARVYPNAPRVIDIGACWSPDSDGYWLSFEFDGNGRLSKVEQGYQAY